jgi:hypothetical protein
MDWSNGQNDRHTATRGTRKRGTTLNNLFHITGGKTHRKTCLKTKSDSKEATCIGTRVQISEVGVAEDRKRRLRSE